MSQIILASTSPYRKMQLQSLLIDFEAHAPKMDEDFEKSKLQNLEPDLLALGLAKLKAESLAISGNTVIGADQLVHIHGDILGKPHHHANAIQQLQKMQGKTHQLLTAVCVIHKMKIIQWCNLTEIKMKSLSDAQIEKYLNTDKPYDCAGSYKIESHGLSLMESIKTEDFTAIQGLPLIELSRVLQNSGYEIPQTTKRID